MKTLKVISLLAVMAVAIFMTSCEQDVLTDDLTEIVEIKDDFSDIESRCTPSAPSPAYLDYLLYNFLAERIVAFNNNPVEVRRQDVKNRYATVVNYLNGKLCFQAVDPHPNWHDNITAEPDYSGPACPAYAVGALNRLQRDIERFLNNETSCTRKRSLQIRFVDYIKTLNICFNAGLDEGKYADRLELSGCSGYYY